jgi:tight adherence protein B
MVGLLTLISPDFQRGLLTAPGLACVALALLLDGLALLIIRRLVRGVL